MTNGSDATGVGVSSKVNIPRAFWLLNATVPKNDTPSSDDPSQAANVAVTKATRQVFGSGEFGVFFRRLKGKFILEVSDSIREECGY